MEASSAFAEFIGLVQLQLLQRHGDPAIAAEVVQLLRVRSEQIVSLSERAIATLITLNVCLKNERVHGGCRCSGSQRLAALERLAATWPDNRDETLSEYASELRGGGGQVCGPYRAACDWDKRVEKALSYLRAHKSSKQLSLPMVADAVGLSVCYLDRLIRRDTGLSYREHVRVLRMLESATLLRSTSLSVQSVADRVGYGSLSQFSRDFRRTFDSAPVRWRAGGAVGDRLSALLRVGDRLYQSVPGEG